MVSLSRFACTPLPLNLQTFCRRILFFGDTLISDLTARWWTRGLANMSCSSLLSKANWRKFATTLYAQRQEAAAKKSILFFQHLGRPRKRGTKICKFCDIWPYGLILEEIIGRFLMFPALMKFLVVAHLQQKNWLFLIATWITYKF